jgi:hypothetical protein
VRLHEKIPCPLLYGTPTDQLNEKVATNTAGNILGNARVLDARAFAHLVDSRLLHSIGVLDAQRVRRC